MKGNVAPVRCCPWDQDVLQTCKGDFPFRHAVHFTSPGCRTGKLFFFSFISMLVKTQASCQSPWNIHINKKPNYINFNDTPPAPAAEREYLVRAFFPKNLNVT